MIFLKRLLVFLILFLLASGGLRLALFTGSIVPKTPFPNGKIVDMHVHIAGYGYRGSGCYVSESIRASFKFNYYLKAFDVSRDELEASGDGIVFAKLSKKLNQSSRVGAAVVLALDGVVDSEGKLDLKHSEIYIPNEFVARETQRYENLYFGASINPYRTNALILLEQVKAQGAKLIKWIPSIQMIDPADERIIPFYKKLIELQLPLLSHTGQERSFTRSKDELADPLRLELPLKLGVTVIAAHVATTGDTQGEDNMQRILPLFDHYPNLYADISSLTQINKLGYLNKILVDKRLSGRLLYGSDFPLVNMVLVSPFYFPLNLSFADMISIARIDNVWDRDVALKQALGVSTTLFERSGQLLNIKPGEQLPFQ